MKIYITGSVASGKSTLARRISQITKIPCYHLDEVVHIPAPEEASGNKKRPIEERDALFHDILNSPDYVMEDAGRVCFAEGMRQADIVILLEIPLFIRKKRIITRWLKQKTGIEKCIYKPTFSMLRAMFQWVGDYDSGADGTKALAAQFDEKKVVLHNNKEIKLYLKTLSDNPSHKSTKEERET